MNKIAISHKVVFSCDSCCACVEMSLTSHRYLSLRMGYQICRGIGIANECRKAVELNNEHAFGNKVNIVSAWGAICKEEFLYQNNFPTM